MKLVKKSLLALATAAALASSAFAAPQTISGVTWDPADGADFLGTGAFTQFFNNGNGSVLSGWGKVSAINGIGTFCGSCQLTFTFGGFTQTSGGDNPFVLGPDTFGFPKTFSGGIVQFWSDTGTAAVNAATAGDGTLWASYIARPDFFTSTLNVTQGVLGYTGSGVLDIDLSAPGTAGLAFNTNNVVSFDPAYNGGDLVMSNTINFNSTDPNQGSTVFSGNTVNVPEPGSLALLGLGLVGLAAARRRKAV